MNIVILGAGALGSVLAGHLARAGEDVTLIARGNRAAYLQQHGVTITGLADFTVPVNAVTDPHQVQKTDVLIVTVKTYDMEAALAPSVFFSSAARRRVVCYNQRPQLTAAEEATESGA